MANTPNKQGTEKFLDHLEKTLERAVKNTADNEVSKLKLGSAQKPKSASTSTSKTTIGSASVEKAKSSIGSSEKNNKASISVVSSKRIDNHVKSASDRTSTSSAAQIHLDQTLERSVKNPEGSKSSTGKGLGSSIAQMATGSFSKGKSAFDNADLADASSVDDTKEQATEADGKDGKYNTLKGPSVTGAADVTTGAVKSAVSGSDAYQGYSEIKHKFDLFGAGTAKRYAGKWAAHDYLHHGMKAEDQEKVRAAITEVLGAKSGDKYKAVDQKSIGFIKSEVKDGKPDISKTRFVGDVASLSSIESLKSNKKLIMEALTKRGVRAENLNRFEAKQMLKKGFIGKGKNRHVVNESDRALLKEFLRLKNQEDALAVGRGKGGIKNTAKAWVQEALGDSDAAKGFQTTKTAVKTAKTAGWAVQGLANGGVHGLTSAVEGGLLIGNKIKEKRTDKKWMVLSKKNGGLTDAQYARWHDQTSAIKARKVKILETSRKVKGKSSQILGKSVSSHVKILTKKGAIAAGKGIGKGAVLLYSKSSLLQKAGGGMKKVLQAIQKNKIAQRLIGGTKTVGRGIGLAGKGIGKVGHVFSIFPKGFIKFFGVMNKLKLVALGGIGILIIIACAFTAIIAGSSSGHSSAASPSEAPGTNESDIVTSDPLETEVTGLGLAKGSLDTLFSAYESGLMNYYNTEAGGDGEGYGWHWVPDPETGELVKVYYGFNITYTVKGSQFDYKYTEDKYTKFFAESYSVDNPSDPDNEEYTHSYDVERVKRAILCCAMGFTHNDERENADFFNRYCIHLYNDLYQKVGEGGRFGFVSSKPKLEGLSNQNPDLNLSDEGSTKEVDVWRTPGDEDGPTNIHITILDGGLPDLCKLDTVDDAWAHSGSGGSEDAKSTGVYADPRIKEFDYTWTGWWDKQYSETSYNFDVALGFYDKEDAAWLEEVQTITSFDTLASGFGMPLDSIGIAMPPDDIYHDGSTPNFWYFNQGVRDYRIKSRTDGATIRSSGCGACACAMACAALLDDSRITPEVIVDNFSYLYNDGWSGMSHDGPPIIAKSYGLDCTISSAEPDIIRNHLRNGGVIVTLVWSSWTEGNTTGGHYIALRGVSEDGNYITVGDSGCRANMGMAFPISQVCAAIKSKGNYVWLFDLPADKKTAQLEKINATKTSSTETTEEN